MNPDCKRCHRPFPLLYAGLCNWCRIVIERPTSQTTRCKCCAGYFCPECQQSLNERARRARSNLRRWLKAERTKATIREKILTGNMTA